MKRALLILAPGFEEVEAITPIDLLRRAGIEVFVAALDERMVAGAHDLSVRADGLLKDVLGLDLQSPLNFDALVLPGGSPGAQNLAQSELVTRWIEGFLTSKKWVCALCASPALVLGAKGFLKGHDFTCYPDMEDLVTQGSWKSDPVVVSEPFITSRGLGTSALFSLEIISQLVGASVAHTVAQKTLLE